MRRGNRHHARRQVGPLSSTALAQLEAWANQLSLNVRGSIEINACDINKIKSTTSMYYHCHYYALGAPPHNLDFLQKRTIIYPRPKIVMKQVYMNPTELKISVLTSILLSSRSNMVSG